jgi:hypothetical protein
MRCRVVWYKSTDASEVHVASFVRVEELSQVNQHKARKSCLLLTGLLLHLLFDPEDGGNMFLQNVGGLLPNNTVLQPRRQYCSKSPLWKLQIEQYTVI